MRHRVLALALLAIVPAPLLAQQGGGSANARSAIAQAIRAYRDLDFDVAATLLRRALTSELDDSTRRQALTYLGAAEHYRGHADSAAAAFRRLVVLAPEYRPDTLVFPPEITQTFEDVRSRTQVAAVVARVDTPAATHVADTVPHPTPPPSAPPVTQERGSHRVTATAAGALEHVRARSESGGLPPASGTVPGISAAARLDRFELGVRYVQGSLGSRDLIEGAAALRFAATPWLTLHTGPHIRRFDAPSGAERWVSWQFGARAAAPLSDRVRGYASLWRGVVLSVNVPPGSGSTTGVEAGLTVEPGLGPLWLGLAYGVDRSSVSGSSRRETLQALTITVGLR